MGVREIERFLERWQMEVKDLRRRMILAPTPRERERGMPPCCRPKAGRHRRRRRHWNGTLTPSDDGCRASGRAGPQP